MKLLIAVLSCQRDRPLHDTIRSTWGRQAKAYGVDVRFFLEPPPEKKKDFIRQANDEVHVSAPGARHGLSYKVREVCKWANGKMIDNLFVCYTTSTPNPEKLVSVLGRFDYAGHFEKPIGKPFRYDTVGPDGQPEHYERCYPWATGLQGYFLSRKAYTEVASQHPSSTIDDLWVGQVLGPLVAEGEIICLDIPKDIV